MTKRVYVRAAQRATSTIPIVITAHDPVGMGFVQSFAHPGGNITGVAFQDAELSTKRLDLLRESVPRLSRAAILWHKEGSGTGSVQAVEASARGLGIQVLVLEIRNRRTSRKPSRRRSPGVRKGWSSSHLPSSRGIGRQPDGALSSYGVLRRSNSQRRPAGRPSGRAAARI